MAKSGGEDSEVEQILGQYWQLRGLALREFPRIVEDAVIERDPGDAPRNLRIFLVDSSFLDVWVSEKRYSLHWQSEDHVIRFDNAPHHDEIATFPHHLHRADGIESSPLTGETEDDLRAVLTYLEENSIIVT